MVNLDDILRTAVAQEASDVHVCVGLPPVYRIHGSLERQQGIPLTLEALSSIADQVIPAPKREEFAERGEVDFAYSVPRLGRFRVNVYQQRGSIAMAFRFIPYNIVPLEELSLPAGVAETIMGLCNKPNGLVLVTGPTGSGKSTTLASALDYINSNCAHHIITLEDPIEFLHSHKQSVVNQREVGSDTGSFARGLRASLRQDPDVILVGEMRDLDTIQIALEAAETGHLVFATLHTNSAPATVDRIIDVFPPAQQQQVRVQLAGILQGIICQRLFRRQDVRGRFAATEVLVVTAAVRNLVREAKTHQLMSVIQTGGRLGMMTMEASVKDLYARGIISQQDYQTWASEIAALGDKPRGM